MLLATSLLAGPAAAQTVASDTATAAATASPAPLTAADAAQLRAQLQALREQAKTLADQANALERRLDAAAPAPAGTPPTATAATAGAAAPAKAVATIQPPAPSEQPAPTAAPTGNWGEYTYPKGFILVRSQYGEARFNLVTYVRYTNQLGYHPTYTDSFGRTIDVVRQQNFELSKVQLTFQGWVLTPNFRYNLYTWTQNAAQGQDFYIAEAGNIMYHFSNAFELFAGIQSLPTTRSTNRTFPFWLRNDNRTIADEFFRGSYTQGIWAQGTLTPGLEYRVFLANNLSTLGVDASRLDHHPNTISGALTWMPTTHEYGPLQGWGDFENHQKLATLFGLHFSYSRETAEEQPGVNSFENTQLRLSDGTLIFKPDAFNTGGQITKATYKMFDANAGFKYRGFSLDGEYYVRWLGSFRTVGFIPVTNLFDQGFQLQGSAMLLPKRLQSYFSGSKIFGQYGDPYDLALGLNWFPFKAREFRLNIQGIYVHRSPVGYLSYILPMGADGWGFSTDASLFF